jgi:hypothetical protein
MDEYIQEVSSMGRTIADALWEEEWKKAFEEGIEQGEIRALRHILVRQLRKRFGQVPPGIVKRIKSTTDTPQLHRWLRRIVTVSTLKQMKIRPHEEPD